MTVKAVTKNGYKNLSTTARQKIILHIDACNLLINNNQLYDAISCLYEIIKIHPHPYYFNVTGDLWLYLQHKEIALFCYNQAIQCDPKYLQSYYNKIAIYTVSKNKKNIEQALQSYDAIIKNNPYNKLDILIKKANLLHSIGSDNAITVYKQALECTKNDDTKQLSIYNKIGSYYYNNYAYINNLQQLHLCKIATQYIQNDKIKSNLHEKIAIYYYNQKEYMQSINHSALALYSNDTSKISTELISFASIARMHPEEHMDVDFILAKSLNNIANLDNIET